MALCGMIAPASAEADSPGVDDRAPAAGLGTTTVSPPLALPLPLAPRWRPEWVRFDLPHAILSGTSGAAALGLRLFVAAPRPGWKDEVLFDRAFAQALRADDAQTRATLSEASDVLQLGFLLYPFLVDAALVASVIHDDPDLGFQLGLISMESLLVSSLTISATKSFVGRVRPDGEPCPGTTDDYGCRSETTRSSFVSGHTTLAFASAGTICATHVHLDLYGGGWGDIAACAGAVGLATTTGLLRVAAGKHYGTDVVAGALLGFATGYFVPTLLHFTSWAPVRSDFGVVPTLPTSGPGLALIGWF